MTTKVQTIRVENQVLRLESDVHEGEILDTCIFINGYLLVTIAGSDIQNFIKEFTELINKYKI